MGKKKQEKYSIGKVVIFTVQSLILNQYPVNLLTFLEVYLESSKYLKVGKFVLVGAICQGNLKVKLPVYVREMRTHFLSTAVTNILAHVSTSFRLRKHLGRVRRESNRTS